MQSSRGRVLSRGVASVVAGAALFCLLAAPSASGSLQLNKSWDGGSTIRAFEPNGLAVDSEGNAFVGNFTQGSVSRIEPDDVPDLAWGTTGATPDNFGSPTDLAVDDDDNLYAIDQERKTIRKFSNSGQALGSWTVPQSLPSDWSITFESGSIWLLVGTTVYRYDTSGNLLGSWDGFSAIPDFVSPIIRGDGDGHLVIASAAWQVAGQSATRSIYRFDLDGTLLSTWTQPASVSTSGSLTTVAGYSGLAVDGSGGIWVPTGDTFAFREVGPDGFEPGGVGTPGQTGFDLVIDGSGRFWSLNWTDDPLVRRIDGDGTDEKTWSKQDLPDYADQVTPASYHQIDDLSVNSEGQFAVLDGYFHNLKVFDGDGEFQHRAALPQEVGSYYTQGYVQLFDDGSSEVADLGGKRVLRFDPEGAPDGETAFDLPGQVYAETRTPSGGHLVVSAPRTVTNFDASGEATGTWYLTRDLPDDNYPLTKIEVAPNGDVYVLTPGFLDRYSPTGTLIDYWSLEGNECPSPGHGWFSDMAIGDDGRIYVAAQLSYAGLWNKLYVFGPSLDPVWTENLDGPYTNVEAAPDGPIYLARKPNTIDRYVHTGPDEVVLGSSCPTTGPAKVNNRFSVGKVRLNKRKGTAAVQVKLPGAGKLVLIGSKTVKRRTVSVKRKSTINVTVKATGKAAKTLKKKRKVKVKATFRFTPSGGKAKTKTKSVTLRR